MNSSKELGMKSRTLVAVSIGLFLWVIFGYGAGGFNRNACAQTASKTESRPIFEVTQEADLDPKDEYTPQYFLLRFENSCFQLNNNGELFKVSNGEKTSWGIVPIEKGWRIYPSVRYLPYGNSIVCIYQITDEDCGCAGIFSFDTQSKRLLWHTRPHGFPGNIGEGLRQGKFLYFTGIGFVGKLNLDTGKVAWSHGFLYEKKDGAFNFFKVPKIEGGIVVFTEKLHPNLKRAIRSIRVDIKTGKILSK
jgi:hypothetical protein